MYTYFVLLVSALDLLQLKRVSAECREHTLVQCFLQSNTRGDRFKPRHDIQCSL